jgi:hypothetical protein
LNGLITKMAHGSYGKKYDISYNCDGTETVTTEDPGYYTGTITAGPLPAIKSGSLHPGYGAVPPNNAGSGTVIISSPAATATYTPTSVTVAPGYANTSISANNLSSGSGYTYTTGTGGGSPWASNTITGGKLNLEGKDADININGKSLVDTLQALEERLNILVPNPELEKEWAELKRLGDRYRKLETDLKEKAAMWAALKAEDR